MASDSLDALEDDLLDALEDSLDVLLDVTLIALELKDVPDAFAEEELPPQPVRKAVINKLKELSLKKKNKFPATFLTKIFSVFMVFLYQLNKLLIFSFEIMRNKKYKKHLQDALNIRISATQVLFGIDIHLINV